MTELSAAEVNTSPGPQVVPHSREAEEAVIGAILINPEAYYDVAQFLSGDDFYIHRHRWIWDAFTHLQEGRTPIDFLTVTEQLDQMGQLGEVGGPAYLTALVNNVPTSLHAEAYGRVVHLQPMEWKDAWPVMGRDEDGDGIAEIVGQTRDIDQVAAVVDDGVAVVVNAVAQLLRRRHHIDPETVTRVRALIPPE